MPDDELRSLERATRESPTDLVLRKRFLSALERAAGPRASFLEVARLARGGDAHARVALDDLVPFPTSELARLQLRARRAALSSVRKVASSDNVLPGYPVLIGATDTRVFVRSSELVLAFDTRSLHECWRRELAPDPAATMCGTDVLTSDGRDLVILDGESGQELARSRTLGTVLALASDGDRAAALIGANDGRLSLMAAFDLGAAFGRTLWKALLGGPPLTTGQARAKLVAVRDGSIYLSEPAIHLLSVETGVPNEERRTWYHGQEELAAFRRGQRAVGIDGATFTAAYGQLEHEPEIAVYRPSTRSAYQLGPLPPLRRASAPRQRYHRHIDSLAPMGDALYVLSAAMPLSRAHHAWSLSTGADFAHLLVLDVATGEVRVDLNIEADLSGEFHTLQLVPLEKAIVVTIATPGSLVLARIE